MQRHIKIHLLATADHSTGGLSTAKGKDYKWNPEAIHKMKHSGMYMTKQIADGKDPEKVIKDGYGIDFPNKQLDKVKKQQTSFTNYKKVKMTKTKKL